MKKITALLVGIAFSLSMAGLSVAQQPAAPATEQKKEMMDKSEKGEKKAKKPTKKRDSATADEGGYQKKEGPKQGDSATPTGGTATGGDYQKKEGPKK